MKLVIPWVKACFFQPVSPGFGHDFEENSMIFPARMMIFRRIPTRWSQQDHWNVRLNVMEWPEPMLKLIQSLVGLMRSWRFLEASLSYWKANLHKALYVLCQKVGIYHWYSQTMSELGQASRQFVVLPFVLSSSHPCIPEGFLKPGCWARWPLPQEYLLMKTADFVQEKSEEIELSLSDAIRVTGRRVGGNHFDGRISAIFCPLNR